MRELNDTEKQQLEQHRRWLTGNGEEGARLGWSDADLSYANLSDANLSDANLSRATLSGADLRRANLLYANLSYADLRDANLRDANLIGANLRDADLSWANLVDADLSWANLCRANLVDADLSGADLRRANLLYANLSYANLSYANLSGADLSGANLRRAIGIVTITPRGSRGDMLIAVIHKSGWMVKAGCFWGTLNQFAAAVERDHANDKWGVLYRADIAMLRATEQVFLDEYKEREVNRGQRTISKRTAPVRAVRATGGISLRQPGHGRGRNLPLRAGK